MARVVVMSSPGPIEVVTTPLFPKLESSVFGGGGSVVVVPVVVIVVVVPVVVVVVVVDVPPFDMQERRSKLKRNAKLILMIGNLTDFVLFILIILIILILVCRASYGTLVFYLYQSLKSGLLAAVCF